MTELAMKSTSPRDSTTSFTDTPPKLSDSQRRVRLGLQLIFYAIAGFALLLILPLIIAGNGFVYSASWLVGIAAAVAFIGGCGLCFQEARFTWSKGFLIVAAACFALPLILSVPEFGLRIWGLGGLMLYLLAEERGARFLWRDSERGYMIPAATFLVGAVLTIGIFYYVYFAGRTAEVDVRTDLILLVPYGFAVLMTYVRIPSAANPFANQ